MKMIILKKNTSTEDAGSRENVIEENKECYFYFSEDERDHSLDKDPLALEDYKSTVEKEVLLDGGLIHRNLYLINPDDVMKQEELIIKEEILWDKIDVKDLEQREDRLTSQSIALMPSCSSLSESIQIDKETFECFKCNKEFKLNCSLKRHLRIHKGEKPFKCLVCNKVFTESGHLKKHMKIHTGEKPYTCSVCHDMFSQSSHLSRHVRIHTGEKPFKCYCSICFKSFSVSYNLNKHMRCHAAK